MDIFLIHGVNRRSESGHTFAGAKGSGEPNDGFAKNYRRENDAMRTKFAHACESAGWGTPRFCPVYWGVHGPRFHFYDTSESDGKTMFRPLVQQRNLAALVFSRKQRSQGASEPYVEPVLAAVAEELALIAGRFGHERVTLADLVLAEPQPVLEAMLAPEHLAHRSSQSERLQSSKQVADLARRIATEPQLRATLRETSNAGEGADLALLELLQRELSRRGAAAARICGFSSSPRRAASSVAPSSRCSSRRILTWPRGAFSATPFAILPRGARRVRRGPSSSTSNDRSTTICGILRARSARST